MHEIQKKFGQKYFFWSIMKVTSTKKIHNISHQIQDLGQSGVENQDFLKKKKLKKFQNFF